VYGTQSYAFEDAGKFEGDCIILIASHMAFRGVADALLDKIYNLHRINLSKAIQTLLNAVIQRRKPSKVVENVQVILGIGKLDSPSVWGTIGPSQSHSYVSKLDFIHVGQPTTGTVSDRTFTTMGGLQGLSGRRRLPI
jgi:hypothetical protein